MDWSNLPEVLVLVVYTYLDDVDRLHMACACKSWGRLFDTPSLWRFRRIKFSGYQANKRAKREINFFYALGKHVRTLIISLGIPTIRTSNNISTSAEYFLRQLLRCPQLKISEIGLDHTNFEYFQHFRISKNRIIGAICRLLRHLRLLHKVNLQSCRVSLLEGCRILEAMARGHGHKTISILFTDDLFQSHIIPTRNARYITAMTSFKNLTHLDTNYTSLNVEMLQKICENVRGTLEKLSLSINRDVRGNVIPMSAWTRFSRRCPNVKVVLYLYVYDPSYDIRLGLVNGIPVSEVITKSCDFSPRTDDMQGQFLMLLKHIAKNYSNTIESLTLQLGINPNLDDVLLDVLKTCRRIRHLDIRCKLTVDTVVKICRLQAQGKIELHYLRLNLHSLTDEEWRQLNMVRNGLANAIKIHR